MWARIIIFSLASFCLGCCLIFDCAADDAQRRPNPGGPLRYNEDWSFLRDSENQNGSCWERFKYVPLGHSDDVYVTFGNEFRARYEYLGAPNWGEAPTDPGGYFWFRALPVIDLHLGDCFRLFGELIIAPSAGVEPRPTGLDDDVGDILQGFAEVELLRSTKLRAGRRILSIGSERLVGTRYGVNTPQSFDMIELWWGDDTASVFALYGRPVDVEVGGFNDDWSRTRQGWTVYSKRDLVDAGIAASGTSFLDLYYMGFENTDATFDQGSGLEQRQTFAGRLYGASDRWRWDHELFIQLGKFANTDIQAWSLATLFWYTPAALPFEMDFEMQFNIVSGDRDRNDGKLGTFNPMFPRLKYFGEAGVLSPANLFDLNPGITIPLTDRIDISADVQFLWRYALDDGIYGPGGRLIRSGAGSDARYVGTGYEIGTEFVVSENCNCNLYYSLLTPGAFLSETGAARNTNYVGIETTLSY